MRRKLIFEKSRPGRKAYSLPLCDVPTKPVTELIPEEELREETPELPEVSEVDLVRHYTRLSRLNHGVDTGFYPLGSCTMKYNPKVHEDLARLDGLANIHPYQPEETVQGCLEIIYRLEGLLAEITGMDRFSLQPAAGAHGELTGMMIIKAFHEDRGDTQRRKIIVPASAHGTNPASAALAGFEILPVASNERGLVDLEALRSMLSPQIAGLMLTNPNTLGLFEEEIAEIADLLHQAGGLLYYDGANANAILGLSRPGEMGFDVMHLNLHKTFATPHGGGGPGSGPVGVKKELVSFLPLPLVEYQDGRYFVDYDRPLSIGRVKSFYGNFGVMVKAYAYIRSLGAEGLRRVSEAAILNANYLKHKLREFYDLPYEQTCLHELVLSAQRQKEAFGVSAQDIAKRLLDFGFHPPTVYFPLIVKEALMIEPTETESQETLDEFIEAMSQIAREAQTDPEKVREAPHTTAVSRMDETKAARTPVLRWGAKD